MEIEILEQDEYNLRFILKDVSIEMVNSIRRIMMSWIPCMAIDEVIILKNDSPLYDEILAHRIGMIPLKTDLDSYKLPEDCECGGFGCPNCQCSLTCEIMNDTKNTMVIYSGDLKTNDPNIVPVNPNIPIVKIDSNSSLIFEAYATLGRGRTHIKWQPVSNAFFRYLPQIEFDDSKCKNCPDKCIVSRMCPENLYDFSNGKKPELVEDYWKKCTLCRSCEENCPEDAVKVDWNEKSYIFSIESDGVLPFDMLIEKTFEIFLGKIDEFQSDLEQIEVEE
ncbi:MAG: DNA-directed RNA polymerase subunit D [Candidatus Lokiarchaeota archaeon]|nr:DNA-directed RNA polymerase subunit D [Candidatus Lokiarchaeota archaeon]MBD3200102.1 DNA-directed RNA polymerase subunit D [Candidatus Lokiarchaeota archaeon]